MEIKSKALKVGDVLSAKVIVPMLTKNDDVIEDKTRSVDIELIIRSTGRLFANAEWIGEKIKPKFLKFCKVEIEDGKFGIRNVLTAKKIVIGALA
jgi:hypothetical protein